jgi:hypothetical protein
MTCAIPANGTSSDLSVALLTTNLRIGLDLVLCDHVHLTPQLSQFVRLFLEENAFIVDSPIFETTLCLSTNDKHHLE